ncbi:MAG TPA: permease [Campylobacterales bacterium]|nr:permease [Campylobacterales bacterium]
MLPMLLGVIGLIGMMQTYITPDMLSKLFGYGLLADIGTGTVMGAISSGNPAVSYIIADELLTQGVTLYAVSAFILSWVTLGIVQLPAEASVFGVRFTVYKNVLTLISTLLVAYFTVITLGVFTS